MDQKTVTEVKAGGQTIKTTVTQTIETTWAVKSVDDAGAAEMTQTIDRVHTKIESPFGAIEYDSNSGKEPEGPIAATIVPTLKVLVGAVFRYKMSPQGELSDIRVPEGLVKSLKESSGPAAQNVGMFSEEGLKNMIHESSLVLPSGPLDKPWTRQAKIPSPPIGTLTLAKNYKYEGTDEGLEKIGLSVNVSLEPDPKFAPKLSEQEGKGTFLFDNKAGRVARSTVSEKVVMTFSVMDMDMTQSTDTSTTMKLLKAEAAK